MRKIVFIEKNRSKSLKNIQKPTKPLEPKNIHNTQYSKYSVLKKVSYVLFNLYLYWVSWHLVAFYFRSKGESDRLMYSLNWLFGNVEHMAIWVTYISFWAVVYLVLRTFVLYIFKILKKSRRPI